MSLVNQSHRLIAILLQSPPYKSKIEDLVTIRKKKKTFISSSMDPLLILIQLEVLIQFTKKLCFVIS